MKLNGRDEEVRARQGFGWFFSQLPLQTPPPLQSPARLATGSPVKRQMSYEAPSKLYRMWRKKMSCTLPGTMLFLFPETPG